MDTEPTYAELYKRTIPSVVSIYLTPAVSDDRPVGGAGSGFVYDERGYVVTNAHVVGGSSDIDLRFSDGDWRTGDVVGTDTYTDLAVVYVADLPDEAVSLPVARENPEPASASPRSAIRWGSTGR